jgi:nucleoside-diphosphate-sugar epimerase
MRFVCVCTISLKEQGFLEASEGKVPEGDWLFSDVRDVALAHILAAINPAASGRYIISQPLSLNARQVTDILKVIMLSFKLV